MRVHILSQRPDVPLRASRHAASFHTWRPGRGESLIDRAAAVAHAVGADVAMAVDENALRALAYGSPGLPFRSTPVPPAVEFDAAHDKWHLARVLSEHRLPHPLTHLTGSTDAPAQPMRFPVLLKPRRGSNGIGITRLHSADALARYVERHPRAIATTILQEEVPGRDIDCSVLCQDGEVLAHTIQRALSPARDRFQPSAGVEFVAHDEVLRVVRRLMAALSWSGVAHVDLREHAATGRIDVIEVNPRFWGSLLGSLHAGVNFPQLTALSALGVPLPAVDYRHCRYASGTFALKAWLRAAVTGRASDVGFRETPLVHAIADPGPHIVEMIDRCRSYVNRSIAWGAIAVPSARPPGAAASDRAREVAAGGLKASPFTHGI